MPDNALFLLHRSAIPTALLPEESFAEARPQYAPAPGTVGYWVTGIGYEEAGDDGPYVVYDQDGDGWLHPKVAADKLLESVAHTARRLLGVPWDIRVTELTKVDENTWRPVLKHYQYAVKLWFANDRHLVIDNLTQARVDRIVSRIEEFDRHPLPDDEGFPSGQRDTVITHTVRNTDSEERLFPGAGVSPQEVTYTYRIAQIIGVQTYLYTQTVTPDEWSRMQQLVNGSL